MLDNLSISSFAKIFIQFSRCKVAHVREGINKSVEKDSNSIIPPRFTRLAQSLPSPTGLSAEEKIGLQCRDHKHSIMCFEFP